MSPGNISFSTCPLPAVIVPELFRTTGGVQVFSRRMIEALDAIFERPVPVISRNDRAEDCPRSFLKGRTFHGCGEHHPALRRFFVVQACLQSDAPSFLASHPHFAPWLRYQRRILKQPYLCVAHGIDVWKLERAAIIKGLMRADCLLPVSRFTENRIREQLGSGTPPVEVFPNTFDDLSFRPGEPEIPWRERLGIPANVPLMLSVCRVSTGESGKGYDRILEAMPELIQRHRGLTWVLGGKGDDLPRVREKAAALGVLDRCRFPGFIPDEELVDLYRSANLFVLPSKKEGFGIVFLEAAACGLPVIAGNRDGSVDALAHGELGTLIDPDSPGELMAAIDKVLASPPPDAGALHRTCVEKFGKDTFRERLKSILEKYPRLLGIR